ncbi:hypothetical protein CPB84DRAFT_1851915 [Gymnopilus junonius]|uniref:BTB domain-containing protein n=1 Tax=Gymnopilus junonius TaxID=109634 RepID=A0A9P5NE82_GYMJU|nr:hypothetical protein CPB84DRAFT_1851915 [Gymnopilus junonius]
MAANGTETGSLLLPLTPSISESSLPEVVKDEDYYLEGHYVEFEVEGYSFRLPSHAFTNESPYFAKFYNLADHGTDGGEAIKLKDVSRSDFYCLLKVLCPPTISLQLDLSKEEWVSVLKLSTKYKFLRLREMAKKELDRMPLVEPWSMQKVCLGWQLYVPSWVTEGLVELVRRHEIITEEEALQIDLQIPRAACKLYRIRELEARVKKVSGREAYEERVTESFDDEFRTLRFKESDLNVAKDGLLELQKNTLRQGQQQKARMPITEKELLELEKNLLGLKKNLKQAGMFNIYYS